jgi:hypothetical protein
MGQLNNLLKKEFGQVPNKLVFDTDISDRARFIFVWMACKPDSWEFIMSNMCHELRLHEDTVRKHLKELIDSGWLVKGEQIMSTTEEGKPKFGGVEYTLKAFNDK